MVVVVGGDSCSDGYDGCGSGDGCVGSYGDGNGGLVVKMVIVMVMVFVVVMGVVVVEIVMGVVVVEIVMGVVVVEIVMGVAVVQ